MLERTGGALVGLEVKASAAVTGGDFKGLRSLQAVVGPDFTAGVLRYTGRQTVQLGDRLCAMPLAGRWPATQAVRNRPRGYNAPMDAHALDVLEFAKVRDLLAQGAASALGLEAVAALTPTADAGEVRRRQQETSEARRILDAGHDLPLGGLHDLRAVVQQVDRGGVVDGPTLLAVAETLRCLERVQHFLSERPELPALHDLAVQLVAAPALADELERCLGDDGEVADQASAELRRLRQLVRSLQARVQATLRKLLGDLAGSDAVQDAVVTIRQGRYVVPIKASHQGQFEGLIHDRSASGQTVFMEPAAVVRLNNELRDAELAERDEVQRILGELSRQVAERSGDLKLDLRLLTILDLIRARGRLSVRLEAFEPELAENGAIDLRRARHPLLVDRLGRRVVPIDVQLNDEVATLLITGPNTGGKTVSLKTVGLLTLMAQAGLHIPADPGSRLALCGNVFADIGDEQSLEQSLSTFGAHLKQLVAILQQARTGDLVLLDEVGAGTDPTEGAALAEALLAELHRRGCRVIATTHHGSLKRFAYETAGVENASVEFDAHSLAPTFRLLTGVPGASHAFEIAARYGLPGEVLDAAKALLPAEHHDAAGLITEMQASQRRLQSEVRAAEHEAAIASHERRELERERQRLRELERQIREEATRDAARLLEQVQRDADTILAELRQAPREGQTTERARQRLRHLRGQVAEARPLLSTRRPTAPRPPATNLPDPGDTVEVLRLGCRAQVLSVSADGELEVQAGAMRMKVRLDEIAFVERAAPPPEPTGRRSVALAAAADLELHVRGQTVDEALANLDRYLDHALLSNLPEVRIVHGKGTGTLKRACQEYLRNHPYVKSFQHPPENLGGTGVTVAKLDL